MTPDEFKGGLDESADRSPVAEICGNRVMKLCPLHSEEEYDLALTAIEVFFETEPEPGTPEADDFDLLALVIADYEQKHWRIDPPDPE